MASDSAPGLRTMRIVVLTSTRNSEAPLFTNLIPRQIDMKDYYQILELNHEAEAAEIAERIKEKKRLWVQRQNAPRPEQRAEAEENLRLLPSIEATLLDHGRRCDYDLELKSNRSTAVLPPPLPAPSHQGDSNPESISRGWELVQAGNIPEALSLALTVCRQFPDDASAWQLKAFCEHRWNQTPEAIVSYRKAIALMPNTPLPYYFLGEILEERGDIDEAERLYECARHIDPDDVDYEVAIAKIKYHRSNFSECIEILEQCLHREPEHQCRNFLAVAYRDKGMEDWEHINSGEIVASKKSHIEKAESFLERVKQLGSTDPNVATLIEETRVSIESSKKRSFHGNWIAAAMYAVGGAFYVLVALATMADPNTDFGTGFLLVVFSLIFGLGIPALYVMSCMTPGYLFNRRALAGRNGTSMDAMFDGQEGCVGMIFMSVLIMMLMPVFIIVNFIRNYAMD